jgi:ornithine cyclodeaminase/alanine dehydrogenase-like protein (mu-crystallin family)
MLINEIVGATSRGLPQIDAEHLNRLLPMKDAVEILRAAFATYDLGSIAIRTAHSVEAGNFLTMPAFSAEAVGIKMVGVAPGNRDSDLPTVHSVYALFNARNLIPCAILDGNALTDLRTPAVSALATDLFARRDASHLTIIGSGVQAKGHLDAMMAVRHVRKLSVVSRNARTAAELVEYARRLGVDDASSVDAADIAEPDIICCCTTSMEPVLQSSQVPDGCHINAVGAFKATMRELSGALVRRGRLAVEDRGSALAEAGDLVLAAAEGNFDAADIVVDLQEAVRGADLRRDDKDVTIFKSVGLGFEDLAIATEVFRRWQSTVAAN